MKRARSLWRMGALIVCTLGLLVVGLTARPPEALSAGPRTLSVVGNHFVNGQGQTIRLLGVNREGTEYACVKGTGYAVGPVDASDAAAIAAWHTNAVRIPINEDCWLGINGLPAYGTAGGYRQMIKDYVAALNARGIYAILDLQWTAPGTYPADGLRSMPDDHSRAFWTSVATTFLHNPAVLFDVFNEPHSVSWSCWRDGGCTVPATVDGTTPDPSKTFTAVGMQSLIDAIRATGARQPILVAGLNHGNDLSGWLSHMPTDPDGQLAASFHVYQPNACNTTACWDSTVAPVAGVVPMTTLEFSEQDCSENWDNSLMNWDDAHGIGYLGWGWFILTRHCQSLYLITDWAGTPASPNGTALHDHLAALWAAGDGTVGSSGVSGGASGGVSGGVSGGPSGSGAEPAAGGSASTGASSETPGTGAGRRSAGTPAGHGRPALRLAWIRLTSRTLSVRLRSTLRVRARLSATTAPVRTTASWGSRRQLLVGLGAKRFALPARRWRVITVQLPRPARRILSGRVLPRATVTVSATASGSQIVTMVRTIAVRSR